VSCVAPVAEEECESGAGVVSEAGVVVVLGSVLLVLEAEGDPAYCQDVSSSDVIDSVISFSPASEDGDAE
jgi:hypothetical protein